MIDKNSLLGLTEFEENLFEFVSKRVVPDKFLDEYEQLVNEVVFALYNKYVYAFLSIRDCADLFEAFVDSLFITDIIEKPKDSIKI